MSGRDTDGVSNARDPRDLRASDADRERVAETLRRHAVDGRLTLIELEERLTEAYAARTVRDLDVSLRELPALPSVPPPVSLEGYRPARGGGRRTR